MGKKSVLVAVVSCLHSPTGLDIAPWCLKVLFILFGMVTVMVVWFSLLLIKVLR